MTTRASKAPACAVCERPRAARCRRCENALCRAHAPPASADLCAGCEADYRPLSPKNALFRLVFTAAGTLAGAGAGFSLALVFGSALFLGDPVRVRVAVMAGTMIGTAIGFGSSHVAASAWVRARFIAAGRRVRLPRARARSGRRAAGSPGGRRKAAPKFSL